MGVKAKRCRVATGACINYNLKKRELALAVLHGRQAGYRHGAFHAPKQWSLKSQYNGVCNGLWI